MYHIMQNFKNCAFSINANSICALLLLLNELLLFSFCQATNANFDCTNKEMCVCVCALRVCGCVCWHIGVRVRVCVHYHVV